MSLASHNPEAFVEATHRVIADKAARVFWRSWMEESQAVVADRVMDTLERLSMYPHNSGERAVYGLLVDLADPAQVLNEFHDQLGLRG